MGFNLGGIAINRNYETDFEDLQEELGWILEKHSDIDFQTASSNWGDEGFCNTYFTEKGTLMFLYEDIYKKQYRLRKYNTLNFAMSDTAMIHHLTYFEKDMLRRSITDDNNERIYNIGLKLEVEAKSSAASEIIWNQLEIVIGQSFWDIDPQAKATRYTIKQRNGR